MFGFFKRKPITLFISGATHHLNRGDAIEAMAVDGSKLVVTRDSALKYAIHVEAFEPAHRTGKRNHR